VAQRDSAAGVPCPAAAPQFRRVAAQGPPSHRPPLRAARHLDREASAAERSTSAVAFLTAIPRPDAS
jgi:hypothetical protein